MTPVAKIVTDLFMMVLSVLAAPADMKEFRLDMIEHSGEVDTVIVKRTESGFTLFQQQGEKLVEAGTIVAVKGKQNVYVLKLGDVPEQTFDVAASVKNFSLDGLRKATTLDLKANDGVAIRLRRSGGTVYLTPERSRETYACH